MPLTKEQVETLEAEKSSYGCGADKCLACYPIHYRCADCGEDYPDPIANGEKYICENCGYEEGETDELQ